jgi:hypothetical protein
MDEMFIAPQPGIDQIQQQEEYQPPLNMNMTGIDQMQQVDTSMVEASDIMSAVMTDAPVQGSPSNHVNLNEEPIHHHEMADQAPMQAPGQQLQQNHTPQPHMPEGSGMMAALMPALQAPTSIIPVAPPQVGAPEPGVPTVETSNDRDRSYETVTEMDNKQKGKAKDPLLPKAPKSAQQLYKKEARPHVKAALQTADSNSKPCDVTAKLNENWDKMSPEDKQVPPCFL